MYDGRALELAVRDGRTDHERAVLGPHAAQLLYALDVDEVPEGGEAELEQQEELGATAVERGVLAVTFASSVASSSERGRCSSKGGSVMP